MKKEPQVTALCIQFYRLHFFRQLASLSIFISFPLRVTVSDAIASYWRCSCRNLSPNHRINSRPSDKVRLLTTRQWKSSRMVCTLTLLRCVQVKNTRHSKEVTTDLGTWPCHSCTTALQNRWIFQWCLIITTQQKKEHIKSFRQTIVILYIVGTTTTATLEVYPENDKTSVSHYIWQKLTSQQKIRLSSDSIFLIEE